MEDDTVKQEGQQSLRKVVDSTVAIAFARFFMPVALAIIGYLMTTSFSDLKTSNERLWTSFALLNKSVADQGKDQAVMKVQLDGVIKSVDRLSTTVDLIKK